MPEARKDTRATPLRWRTICPAGARCQGDHCRRAPEHLKIAVVRKEAP